MLYEIKYKFRGEVNTVEIESENQFQAVASLAYSVKRWNSWMKEHENELEILRVSTPKEKNTFAVGMSYVTNEGKIVVMKGISNAGTEYETLYDQHGHHRYSRSQGRIVGRSTGSPVNGPNSITLGMYWTKGE
ncbi:hypothetical protein AVV44_gp233 [Cronobacter phage S13]|jgi:hypothetical protein|uniref:Uncharacterized protein n=1 Tax=Cronobacter phage LPCS28 TaxID=2924885 RepID=A0AAE9G594_9CAUD|nr:hypothetical protein AVV44_gp233 [Cronobacter phage S13]YP_010665788.1 hypothetical protein PQB73_gp236 [Cronobacter phage LPCS28]AIA65005.1 hypothetical protein S13_208 [Cronobacter phage S13]UNY46977.1 hypothetical protein EHEKIMEA_00095 [Cronobacter phage LPCS28]